MSIHDLQEVVIIATKNYEARVTATLVQGSLQQAIDAQAKNTKIQLSNFTLDTSKIVKQIQDSLNNANLKIDLSGFSKQIGNQLGTQLGNQINKQVQSTISNISLKNSSIGIPSQLASNPGTVQRMLRGAGFDTAAINEATKQLNQMSITVQNLKTRIMHNGDIRMRISGIDELGRAVTIVRDFDKATGKVINTSKEFSQSFAVASKSAAQLSSEAAKTARQLASVDKAFSTGSIGTKIAEINKSFSQLDPSSKTESLKRNIAEINQLFAQAGNRSNSDEARIAAYQRLNEVMAATKQQIKFISQGEKEAAKEVEAAEKAKEKARSDRYKKHIADIKKAAQEELNLTKASTLNNNIQAWMNKNTVAAQVFKVELERIQNDLRSPGFNGKSLSQLSAEFQNIKARASSAGVVIKQFALNLKNIGLMALGINSTYAAITKLIQVIRQGAQTVIELDTALVDLKKTTTMSDNDLAQFYEDANEEAKRLGVTTKEIIEQAAAWSRLGYGSKEDATKMASLSSQFAMISPGMSTTQAQESLVSTMKAFGITTDEVLDGVMSKINIVGNNFALSNKDIAEALQVSSASMDAANNSFEQTLALITAGTEITQDASRVGNGLRTISMRIRGLNEETGEFDEELGNVVNDISQLTNGKVSIMEDPNTYKSTYDILKRISEIWDELTDKQQAKLLEKLFGKNRAQIGTAILSNFQTAEEALNKMENSAGNADKEMSIIMESLEYKLNALKQTGVGIWQNLFPREDLGNIIDFLTTIAGLIEKLTGFLGPGGTLLAGGALAAFIANFGWPHEGALYSDIIKSAYNGRGNAITAAWTSPLDESSKTKREEIA